MSTLWVSTAALAASEVARNFLPGRDIRCLKSLGSAFVRPEPGDVVAGWGMKPNTLRAREFATQHGLPFFRLEDGFFSYAGHPGLHSRRLSVIIDSKGIYYDASAPSDLDGILLGPTMDDKVLLGRAGAAMERIRAAGLSKYNHGRHNTADLRAMGSSGARRVLVVDQTAGDQSLVCGGFGQATFDAMLSAAIRENPGAEIIIKAHPDVLLGRKVGHYDMRSQAGRFIVASACNPQRLLDQVDVVYTVSSQLGFEALIARKRVVVFGQPFYAGWGLTDDRGPAIAHRVRKLTMEQLFAGCCLLYPRYINPWTGLPGELEDVLQFLAAGETSRGIGMHGRTLLCCDFSLWKRSFLRPFLAELSPSLRFVSSRAALRIARKNPDASAIVAWGNRSSGEFDELRTKSVPVYCLEDGFVRSVGLGAELRRPQSLVIDPVGIYYDPSRPSRLEQILQHEDFSAEDLQRGRDLRELILTTRVTKYNLGADPVAISASETNGRRVILVTGQIDDDASVILGCRDASVRGNLDLLRAVRHDFPRDFIVYKEHPDVSAGLRTGRVGDDALRGLADRVVTGRCDVLSWIERADVVCTMTSLAGFEALLRGKAVVTYGQPFYAGWGLTEDRHPVARRTRRRSLDELVCATLIKYPAYVDWDHRHQVSALQAVRSLHLQASHAGPQSSSWAGRKMRKAVFLLEALREVAG